MPLQHQATALPSSQGTGRAPALTGHRHALVANQERQPNRVALQKILTINDARYHPHRHPRCRSTILRSVEASEIIGARALLVHALNDTARAFYAHIDFEPSPTGPLHLLLLTEDARSVVGR